MKLGIAIDWASPRIKIPLEKIQLAEALGFDSVWSAEAYGSDAMTPLAYIAGHTKRIRLGTCLTQISARTPIATAMAAATIRGWATAASDTKATPPEKTGCMLGRSSCARRVLPQPPGPAARLTGSSNHGP